MSYAEIDKAQPGAPLVTFPRVYNAAVDLVDRHVAQGRGARIAYRFDSGQLSYAALATLINRWIEFVQELPKTATGKIQRFRLR